MTDARPSSGRIAREQAFHDDRFAGDDDTGRDRFYDHVTSAVDALDAATDHLRPGQRVLELGSGVNSLGWRLAERGCAVTAVDISPVAVERVRTAAATNGVDDLDTRVMNAEALEFEDESFDAVVGTGILHHLDLAAAYREVQRVLRPAGVGVFYEPLGHNPLINAYRRRTPEMRTDDEHPLLRRDVRAAAAHFGEVTASIHECLALGAALAPAGIGGRVRPALQALDRAFLRLPGARWMGWIAVIELRAPRPVVAATAR